MRVMCIGLIALLAAPAGAAEQPLTRDQEDACGAILCLAGGSGVAECAPYLKRFYGIDNAERKDFLGQCPDSGLSSGALGELAAYGQSCQPEKLDDYLNRQICTEEQKERGFPCHDPHPDDWRVICGSFYAELTDEEPPKLVEQCQRERDDSGALETVCRSTWVEADYRVGSWCADKGMDCQEKIVGTEADSSVAAQ